MTVHQGEFLDSKKGRCPRGECAGGAREIREPLSRASDWPRNRYLAQGEGARGVLIARYCTRKLRQLMPTNAFFSLLTVVVAIAEREKLHEYQSIMGDSNDAYAEGFDGYEQTTRDPGIGMLVGTILFCCFAMLLVLPILVRHMKRNEKGNADYATVENVYEKKEEQVTVSARTVLRFDKETRSLVNLAVPFTISSCAYTFFTTVCFIIISKNTTTMEISAYSIVLVLVGLTDGALRAPIFACTTLCAHAVGAGNFKLAGAYLQLAFIFYCGFSVVSFVFWWYFMYDAILWLEGGDENSVAMLGQVFIRHYSLYILLKGTFDALWTLMQVADHATEGTYIHVAWGLTNVVVLSLVAAIRNPLNLVVVAWVFNINAVLFVGIGYSVANRQGWLKPFHDGLFCSVALEVSRNGKCAIVSRV